MTTRTQRLAFILLAVVVALAPITMAALKNEDVTTPSSDLTEIGSPANRASPIDKYGDGYDLDNIDDALVAFNATELRITGNLTIAIAFEWDNDNETDVLLQSIGRDDDTNNNDLLWQIQLNTDGTVRYAHRDSAGTILDTSSTETIGPGAHTLVLRRTDSTNGIEVRVNGTDFINTTLSGPPADQVANISSHIGAQNNSVELANFVEGGVYETRIWNRTLSWSKLNAWENATSPEFEAVAEGNETALYFMEPTAPEGVELLFSDASVDGFTDLTELRTSHSATTPTVWVRERNNGGTQKLFRFDKALSQTGEATICSGNVAFNNDFFESVASFGLAVTSENQPIFPCVRAVPDDTSLHLGDTTGAWGDGDAFIVLNGNLPVLPLDARAADKVVTLSTTTGGNPAVAQANLLSLDKSTESWDADDVSISYGDESWVAYTGPTGTKVTNTVNGVPVAPAIATAFDSVQLHDTSLWVASTSTDEVRRYTVTPGGSLDVAETKSFATDGTHALRITKDGRFLVAEAATNYTVMNSTTLTTLAVTGETITPGGFDVDANNNYLFVIDQDPDRILRFPIFNVTTSSDGDQGVVGSENPLPGSDPLEETATGDTTDPTGVEDDEGLGSFATAEAAAAFGVSETAAGWILAAMTVLGMTVVAGTAGGALVSIQAAEKFALAGIVAGLAISVGFGWIPLWFLAVMGLVSAAVIVTRGGG